MVVVVMVDLAGTMINPVEEEVPKVVTEENSGIKPKPRVAVVRRIVMIFPLMMKVPH